MKTSTKLWIGIGILALLSPLGVFLPRYFHSGQAWGEWSLVDFWKAPFPDYGESALSYIASAVIGIIAVVLTVIFLNKLLRIGDKKK